MLTHLANNEPFLLVNKNYASHDNDICNEFGIHCHIILTQFHNPTSTVNRSTLANNQTMIVIMDIWHPRLPDESVIKIPAGSRLPWDFKLKC